jgi:hypothetical protein
VIKVSARAAQSPWSGFRCQSLECLSRRSDRPQPGPPERPIGRTAASIPKADCEPPLTIMCDAIDCRQVAEALMASATTLRRGDRKRSQSAITQARPPA